jgi:hypothetical protein
MQESHLFEYAVIRVVPHVEREEFLNAGVIVFCKSKKFLKCRTELNDDRLRALCNDLDCNELRDYIAAFERICNGGADAGPIGKLAQAERFRWLTAARSTMVQTSKVHPGLCDDPQEKLDKLFEQLVTLKK